MILFKSVKDFIFSFPGKLLEKNFLSAIIYICKDTHS